MLRHFVPFEQRVRCRLNAGRYCILDPEPARVSDSMTHKKNLLAPSVIMDLSRQIPCYQEIQTPITVFLKCYHRVLL
jgi:hypothetical protein